MNVICVDYGRLTLRGLRKTTQRVVPDARVFACRNIKEAVETARESGCDVLLTGIDMGANRNEGIELARRIKEINPRVNIIFVTVCAEWEHAREVIQLRPSGYVRKPYEQEQLAEEFKNLRYAAV